MNLFTSIRLILAGVALISMTSLVAADGPRKNPTGRKPSLNRSQSLQKHQAPPSQFSWAESSAGQSKLKQNPAGARTEAVDRNESVTFRKRIDKSSPVKGPAQSGPASPSGLIPPTVAKPPSGIIAILIGL